MSRANVHSTKGSKKRKRPGWKQNPNKRGGRLGKHSGKVHQKGNKKK